MNEQQQTKVIMKNGVSESSALVEITSQPENFVLRFRELCFTVDYGHRWSKAGVHIKRIIHEINGEFQSGRLSAIMGPSGSGKTSLLNGLSGFKRSGLTGTIELIPSNFNYRCSYIPQEDHLHNVLTAKEILYIAANLKLSSDVSYEDKRERINQIVTLLGLQNCLYNRAERLSGGERKRLSIGIELISNPQILFFDEPTSGLDSVSSMQVIKYLRNLAHEGRIVIVVIHQPSSSLFQIFDDLYVVSNGHCLYNGPLGNMIPAFQKAGFVCPTFYNPADFVLDVASNPYDKIEQLVSTEKHKYSFEELKVSPSKRFASTKIGSLLYPKQSKKLVTPLKWKKGKFPVSFLKQFTILTKRSFICAIREIHFGQMRFFAHIFVAMLLGTVYWNIGNDADKVLSTLSCLFFFSLFVFWSNCMPTVTAFPLETAVFLREHSNHWYSLGAYYLSKLFADLPLQIICPFLFVVIGYWMTGQPMEWQRFGMLSLITFLTGLLAYSLGLWAGAAMDVVMGVFVTSASTVPLMMFSGFFIRFSELQPYLQPLCWFSFFRYSFEGVVLSIYGFDREDLECDKIYCPWHTADKVLSLIDMSNQSMYVWDVIALVIWILCLQICLYLTLLYRVKSSK